MVKNELMMFKGNCSICIDFKDKEFKFEDFKNRENEIKIVLRTFDGNLIGKDGSYIETYDENGDYLDNISSFDVAQFDSISEADKFVEENKLSSGINQELAIFSK